MKKISAIILVFVMMLSALTACGNVVSEDLNSAKDYLYSMYKDEDNSTTAADFQRVGVVMVNGVQYTVEWTADSDKVKIVVDGKMVKIDVDEKSAEEVKYTLTATVKDADGNTAACTFKHTVPAYAVNSWAEYAAAENNAPLVVTGVVTGIISKSNDSTNNCLYIQDEVGGYYVYGLAEDPITMGIKVGMTVEAKGAKDNYNGTLELKDASVAIVDETIKEVAPVDYTELYKNAESLKDTALVEKQGLLVTIKGAELVAQSDADVSGGYYRFKIGEQASSYVRISSSTCPLNNADKDAFKAAFAEHVGYTADITGVICVYDGAFYLTPVTVDAFANFQMVSRSDDEKVDFENENLKLEDRLTADTVIDLIANGATYEDVAIAWTSDNAAAVIADGKLTVTIPDEETVVTITATLTCGEVTKTAEFKITLSKIEYPEVTIAEALELADGTKVLIKGVVVNIAEKDVWSDKYNNMSVTIADKSGSLYIFRVGTQLKLGDAVTIKGVMATYKETRQIGQDAICEVNGNHVETSLTDANAAEDGTLVCIKGTVTNIAEKDAWSDKYNNISVTISDAEGNTFYIFRMNTKVELNDVITVYGAIGSYKEAKQLAQGSFAIIETAAE